MKRNSSTIPFGYRLGEDNKTLEVVDKEVSEFTSTNDFFFEELGRSKICLYVLI